MLNVKEKYEPNLLNQIITGFFHLEKIFLFLFSYYEIWGEGALFVREFSFS